MSSLSSRSGICCSADLTWMRQLEAAPPTQGLMGALYPAKVPEASTSPHRPGCMGPSCSGAFPRTSVE
eukprot:2524184-Lingulodinium_polyedra.AAC.1